MVDTDEDQNFQNDKRFWMNLINPSSKKEMDVVDKIKLNLTYAETTKAIISFISIIMSQIEYENSYYPNYYENYTPDLYNGLGPRIIYSVLALLLSKFLII
jgi:hypothetical protein